MTGPNSKSVKKFRDHGDGTIQFCWNPTVPSSPESEAKFAPYLTSTLYPASYHPIPTPTSSTTNLAEPLRLSTNLIPDTMASDTDLLSLENFMDLLTGLDPKAFVNVPDNIHDSLDIPDSPNIPDSLSVSLSVSDSANVESDSLSGVSVGIPDPLSLVEPYALEDWLRPEAFEPELSDSTVGSGYATLTDEPVLPGSWGGDTKFVGPQ